MATEPSLRLMPDEFVFRFDTEQGVDIEHLATFLQRAATVARRAGTELVVVGVPEGSVIVKLRAVVKSAKKEFMKAPIATTGAGLAIGGTVVAIVNAMVPTYNNVSPMASAGAALVEHHHVKKIEVITINQTIVVMDGARAAQIRTVQQQRKVSQKHKVLVADADSVVSRSVPRITVAAREGTLSGKILNVDGELHFRPDGYRYLVPVNASSLGYSHLLPGMQVRVRGRIVPRLDQPDSIFIDEITPL